MVVNGELMDKLPASDYSSSNSTTYELNKTGNMEYEKRRSSFSIDGVRPLGSQLTSVLSLTESDEHQQIMKDLFASKQESALLARPKMPQKLSLSDEQIDWKATEDLRPSNRLEPLGNMHKPQQRRRGSMPAVLSSSPGEKPSLLTRQRLLQHNTSMLPKISENTRPQSPATVISVRTDYTVNSFKSSILHDEYLKRRDKKQRRKSFSCSRSDSFSVASSEDFLSEIKRKTKQKWRKMIHQRKADLFAKKEETVTKLPKLA